MTHKKDYSTAIVIAIIATIAVATLLFSCTREDYNKWTCNQSMLTTWPDGDTISYQPVIPYNFDYLMTSGDASAFIRSHTYTAPREGGAYYVESNCSCRIVICQ